MKKLLLVGLLLAVALGGAFAQDFTAYGGGVEGGDILINVGAGVSVLRLLFPGLLGTMLVPPITATVEYALDVGLPLTVGGTVGYARSAYASNAAWTYNEVLVAVRAGYHVDLGIPNLDLYAAVNLGYDIWLWDDNSGSDPGSFYYSAAAGAAYY
ncbi:MAG: hypothetical protein LBT11_05045, partial [Treponema sp.]|nr:hypothetical protein [Treponema sp.]